jgi:hypothetical protein
MGSFLLYAKFVKVMASIMLTVFHELYDGVPDFLIAFEICAPACAAIAIRAFASFVHGAVIIEWRRTDKRRIVNKIKQVTETFVIDHLYFIGHSSPFFT